MLSKKKKKKKLLARVFSLIFNLSIKIGIFTVSPFLRSEREVNENVVLLFEIPTVRSEGNYSTFSFARSEAQARNRAGNLPELTHSADF